MATKHARIIHGSSRTGIFTNYCGKIVAETGNPHAPYRITHPDGKIRTPWRKHILKVWEEK